MSHCTSCYCRVCKGCEHSCGCTTAARIKAERDYEKAEAARERVRAAAPDLLEACELIEATAEETVDDDLLTITMTQWRVVSAAISKALWRMNDDVDNFVFTSAFYNATDWEVVE